MDSQFVSSIQATGTGHGGINRFGRQRAESDPNDDQDKPVLANRLSDGQAVEARESCEHPRLRVEACFGSERRSTPHGAAGHDGRIGRPVQRKKELTHDFVLAPPTRRVARCDTIRAAQEERWECLLPVGRQR